MSELECMVKDAVITFHLAKFRQLKQAVDRYSLLLEDENPILHTLLKTELGRLGRELDETYAIVVKYRGWWPERFYKNF